MILGIDIGSTTISAVQLDKTGQVREEYYEFHKGEIGKGLESLARSLNTGLQSSVALTSSTLLHYCCRIETENTSPGEQSPDPLGPKRRL